MTEEEIDEVVNKALDMMTLKEKVATMSGYDFFLLVIKYHKFGVRPYPGRTITNAPIFIHRWT